MKRQVQGNRETCATCFGKQQALSEQNTETSNAQKLLHRSLLGFELFAAEPRWMKILTGEAGG